MTASSGYKFIYEGVSVMKRKGRTLVFTVCLAIVLIASLAIGVGCAKGGGKGKMPQITIFWAEWDPANYLQELCNTYTEQTGNVAKVETTPWSNFQDKTFNEFAAKGDAYDIVVGDSQWLGRGATQGHYVELTKWIKDKGVDKSMAPATIVAYAEYPKGSGKYYAVPVEGDACGWSYRKDKFEDPKEMAAFKKKYGYDLAVPETWDQLRDIAEFFYRPKEKFYGLAIYTQKDYDALTMGVENVLWAWGADLGDYKTYKVDGVINSEGGVKSLEFYRELYKFTPPDWGNAFFPENNMAITSGLAAMSMNYYAFFPALINPEMNKFAKSMGFFAMPKGPAARVAALGGQGASIIKYSKKQKAAYAWLEWFVKPETQQKWGALGGYTCDLATLQSDEFLNMTPYNRSFMETMQMVKDFWAVPEYAELLEVCQRKWHEYVVAGQGTAKEAMDGVAQEWEAIFQKAGYYKK
jgi:multiple sugar transport system substrate-binding protein